MEELSSIKVQEEERSVSIKIMGFGSKGLGVIKKMHPCEVAGVELIAVDRQCHALQELHGVTCFQFPEIAITDAESGEKLKTRDAGYELKQICEKINEADLVFLVADMGEGDAVNEIVILTEIAKKTRALKVAVVTSILSSRGKPQALSAKREFTNLSKLVDSIIISSDITICDNDYSPYCESPNNTDPTVEIIKNIFEIITKPGYIGVDLCDLKKVLSKKGFSKCGIGTCTLSFNRVKQAIDQAIKNSSTIRLIEKKDKSILVNITGDKNFSDIEYIDAVNYIEKLFHKDSIIIAGAFFDKNFENMIKITLVSTGYEIC